MARQISMILVGALTIIALLPGSISATTYFVGDSNWAIPSCSKAFSDWAANKNFVVGDTLVFSFMQGQHDVAEVTESDYDACDGSKPISRRTVGPANFTLGSSGVPRFICTVSGHCDLGQKLTVNVAGERAPSQSQSPSSSPRSRSAPARGPMTYTAGDQLGWNILAGDASAYETWAASKTFFVGDVLVFNFANARHDVAELSKANYDSCNTNSSVSVMSNGPVRVALDRSGERFFTCTFPGHRNAGQKLAVKVISDDITAASAHGVTPCTSTVDDTPTATSAMQPPNGATSVAAAGFTTTFLAFAALALFL